MENLRGSKSIFNGRIVVVIFCDFLYCNVWHWKWSTTCCSWRFSQICERGRVKVLVQVSIFSSGPIIAIFMIFGSDWHPRWPTTCLSWRLTQIHGVSVFDASVNLQWFVWYLVTADIQNCQTKYGVSKIGQRRYHPP